MFIITILFSFFIALNASEDGVASVGGFLEIIGENLKGNYNHQVNTLPVDLYEKDIIVTYLHDGKRGQRCQLVHDPDHILMKSYDEFDPPKEERFDRGISMRRLAGGTRKVAACSIDGIDCFCFKQWPEAPGAEIAVRQLYKTFISDEDVPMPRSQTIIMNRQCFLVSEFIQGIPLRDFLELRTKAPDHYSFDMVSLQKLFIFCMLANFEDCRLENCLVRQKSTGFYEIILIDTERGLGKEFVKETQEGKNDGTRVHCVLFCFLEMILQPVDVRLRGIDDERARVELLALQNEHLYQLALRQHLHCQKEGETILGIHLGEGFAEDLNKKWRKIKSLLSIKKSLAEIFLYVMPDIASKYLFPKRRGFVEYLNAKWRKIKYGISKRKRLKEIFQDVARVRPDILERCELVDGKRNIEGASAPPSAYCPLDRYICWNSKGTRNMKFILAANPGLTFEQAIEKINEDYGDHSCYYDYYDSKNTNDDLPLSLKRILPPLPIVMSEKEEKYHAEDQEIEQFLREQEEEEEVV